MAHTRSAGATKNGRDSRAKRLGVKLHDGQQASSGMIIIRQRGLRYVPLAGVRRGKDDTLYAITTGVVRFGSVRRRRFDGTLRVATTVAVVAASPTVAA